MIAIKAAWVIVSADDVRERAAVLIDGSRVADVVPWEQIPAGSTVVDRSRAIVHPGFVNAHEHQYGLLSHGIHILCRAYILFEYLLHLSLVGLLQLKRLVHCV